jgi:hypothetical protein
MGAKPLKIHNQDLLLERILLIAKKNVWVGASAPTLSDHA